MMLNKNGMQDLKRNMTLSIHIIISVVAVELNPHGSSSVGVEGLNFEHSDHAKLDHPPLTETARLGLCGLAIKRGFIPRHHIPKRPHDLYSFVFYIQLVT